MYFLGIDPGISGASALIYSTGKHARCLKHKDTTLEDQADWFRRYAENIVFGVIERVHSMPGQGVASSFKFGMSYGCSRMVLAYVQIPHEYVTPQSWQKIMKCRTGGDKNITKDAAQKLFPNVKVTHAIADALLIAEFARRLAIERKMF